MPRLPNQYTPIWKYLIPTPRYGCQPPPNASRSWAKGLRLAAENAQRIRFTARRTPARAVSGSRGVITFCVAFSRGEEEVGFKAVLSGIKLVVTPALCEQ